MRWITLLLSISIPLLLTTGSSAAPAEKGLCSEVPATSWTYDAAQQLLQRGVFTHHAERLFSGKHMLTRYVFATAISDAMPELRNKLTVARLLAAGIPPAKENAPAHGRKTEARDHDATPLEVELDQQLSSLRQNIDKMERLTKEFSEDLDAIGAGGAQQQDWLSELSRETIDLLPHIRRIPILGGFHQVDVIPKWKQ